MLSPSSLSSKYIPIAKNIRITLLAGLLISCTLIAVIALTSWEALRTLHQQVENVVEASDVKTGLIYDMRIAARERNLHLMLMLLVSDPFDIDEQWISFREEGGRFLDAREKLLTLDLSREEILMMEQQREFSKVAVALQYQMYEHILAGDREGALKTFSDHSIYQENVFNLLDELLKLQKDANDIIVKTARSSQDIALTKVSFLSAAIIIIIFLITSYTIRRLSQQAVHIENEGLKFKALIEGSMDAVLVLSKHHVTDCNVNALRMFGVSSLTEMNSVGLDYFSQFSEFKSSIYSYDIFNAVNHALADVNRCYQWKFIDTQGKEFPADVELTGIELEEKPFVQLVIRDATEKENAQRELREANENLEAKVLERTAELKELNSKIAGIARNAGMADVASGVLHNVGNVLNSMNVSMSILKHQLKNTNYTNLDKLAKLLTDNKDNLCDFLINSDKGKMVIPYMEKLSAQLTIDQQEQMLELNSLANNIEHVKNIVTMQQSYAGNIGIIETLQASQIAEEAININIDSINRHQIQLVRNFEDDPEIAIDKHKLIQVLVNIISNAKRAVVNGGKTEKIIIMGIRQENSDVIFFVDDNGVGIDQEDLARVFEFGFKKRAGGHGYGLHHSALMANELGGSISVESDGPDKGARFSVQIPIE